MHVTRVYTLVDLLDLIGKTMTSVALSRATKAIQKVNRSHPPRGYISPEERRRRWEAAHPQWLRALRWAAYQPHGETAASYIGTLRTEEHDMVHWAWRRPAWDWCCHELRTLGAKRYHTSRERGSSYVNSAYYGLPDGRTVRLSDHYLPQTPQRDFADDHGRRGFDCEIVLDIVLDFPSLHEYFREALDTE